MYRTPEIVDLYSNFPIGEKQDIWVRPLARSAWAAPPQLAQGPGAQAPARWSPQPPFSFPLGLFFRFFNGPCDAFSRDVLTGVWGRGVGSRVGAGAARALGLRQVAPAPLDVSSPGRSPFTGPGVHEATVHVARKRTSQMALQLYADLVMARVMAGPDALQGVSK